ncbi:cation channel sperm-associated protein subunit beta-like isoform X1 [Lingula anatina]|uniref:Cation channel sperm-associated protein subunit beta-like isoform X1 n=2 Tax=Lingula anatina TaxID=7574 RepID=A0A1S3HJA3_LINAN|nr:cation channel sperm-associated protein subunit beta-like isoform X1 [Lingula anatina]|eukprot:XP_013386210.1 cation channel sperm-associated protein subunit beta-like isoform X1 [Lingula anatina]
MFAIVFQLLGFVFAVAEQQHYSEPFSFHCSSRYEDITQSVLVFYLKDGPLTIHCQLYDPFLDTAESRKQMTYKYHILAHRPSITFSNSTWRKTFQFDTEVDWEEMTWVTTIPKEDISDDVVASREQWSVIIELDSNLDLFTVHGTLLDTLTDPIFHWDVGPRASQLAGDLVTGQMTLVHTPCESDHVLIMLQTQYGTLLGPSTAPYKTVESITWYNMTEALCSDGSACSGLTVYDMVLTNDHLIILTNRGLYVSNQMTSVNNSHTQLTYTRVDNGTELESHCIADESSHLYYSEVCSRQLDEKVKVFGVDK